MSRFFPHAFQVLVPDFTQIIYLIAIVLFIVGMKRLSSPATARSGNQLSALAMLIGIIVTLLDFHIVTFEMIIVGVIVGSLIGIVSAYKVEMTSMPEMVGIFNGFGGGASVLVAIGDFYRTAPAAHGNSELITVGLSILSVRSHSRAALSPSVNLRDL